MNTNVIFKKLEVVGVSKDEAKANAPFNCRVDATQAFNKWKETQATVTEESMKEWMKEYLDKKKFNLAGDGAFIVMQSPVKDTRERPYKIESPKYESKTHTPEHFYVLRDASGAVVGREKTKKAAQEAMREYISEYKEDVNAFHEYVPKENNALALVGSYVPSKGTRNAVLVAFGYVAAE